MYVLARLLFKSSHRLPWAVRFARAAPTPLSFGLMSPPLDDPVVVDGSMLEGGGQIVRVAAALAAATGRETTVRSIRAGRPKPGLAAQHLAGLDACRRACGGSFVGGDPAVGSISVTLRPGSAAAAARAAAAHPDPDHDPDRPDGEASWRADVGTAGAVSLVAQAAVPALILGGRPARLRITGGTDVAMAPPVGYLAHVLAPILRAHLGVRLSVETIRRGYFPRGGGEVVARVDAGGGASGDDRKNPFPLSPIRLERPRARRGGDAEPAKLACWVVNPRAAGRVDHHEESRAVAVAAMREALSRSPTLAVAAEAMAAAGVPVDCLTATEEGDGDGGSVVLVASSPDGRVALAASSTLDPPRGGFFSESARRDAFVALGTRTGAELAEVVESGAAVDDRLLDQLVVFMALAGTGSGSELGGERVRKSRVVARWPISEHARAAMATCEAVTGAKFDVRVGDEGGVEEGLCAVECVGCAAAPREGRGDARDAADENRA